MRKLLKKSPSDKKKLSDFPAITHTFNDLWHWTCDRTKDKFHTVTPYHNALQPASELYYQNYDEIFRKDKEELNSTEK